MQQPSAAPAPPVAVRLGTVLLIAALLRVLLPVVVTTAGGGVDAFYAPDTQSYVAPAQALQDSGRFGAAVPELMRTPGYPLLLVPGLAAGELVLVTLVLQVLLGTATVALVYAIGRRLFDDPGAALAAAALAAVEPLAILYSAMLLSETLFTFLLTAALLAIVRLVDERRWRDAALAGALLGAATLTRPVSYFLPLGLGALLIAVAWVGGAQRWRRAGQVVVLVAVAMGVAGAWQVRNAVRADYGGVSAISDVNLYFYQGAAVLAARSGTPYYALQQELGYGDPEIYFARHPEQRAWSRAERYRFQRAEGLRILAESPGIYARIHLSGMVRVLADPAATSYLRILGRYPASGGLLGEIVDRGLLATVARLASEQPLVFWSNLLLFGVLVAYYGLALAGLVAGHPRLVPALVLLAAASYFVLISGGPVSENRFRLPVVPILCLFAGAGVVAFRRLAGRRLTR